MKSAFKLLFWKLWFPDFVQLWPVRLRVVSGPFREMRYTTTACASAHSAKLLGTYEKELEAVIAEVLRQPFDSIIDIGAAEGYYAVGLARGFPNHNCKHIAYEAQELGRGLLKELAKHNGVDNLDIRGACQVSDLAEAVSGAGQKLVICDVEGFETELLDPDKVPGLRQCSILVEIHDSPQAPVSEIIRNRFRNSHRIEVLQSVRRTWEDFPSKNVFARLLPRSLALRAMNEGRGFEKWFWMQPAP